MTGLGLVALERDSAPGEKSEHDRGAMTFRSRPAYH